MMQRSARATAFIPTSRSGTRPKVYNWMTLNARKGRIPNGAIIVKEMYTSPTAQLSEWTVMIKDSNISWGRMVLG